MGGRTLQIVPSPQSAAMVLLWKMFLSRTGWEIFKQVRRHLIPSHRVSQLLIDRRQCAGSPSNADPPSVQEWARQQYGAQGGQYADLAFTFPPG